MKNLLESSLCGLSVWASLCFLTVRRLEHKSHPERTRRSARYFNELVLEVAWCIVCTLLVDAVMVLCPRFTEREHSAFYFTGEVSGHNGRRAYGMEDTAVVVLENKAQACFQGFS